MEIDWNRVVMFGLTKEAAAAPFSSRKFKDKLFLNEYSHIILRPRKILLELSPDLSASQALEPSMYDRITELLVQQQRRIFEWVHSGGTLIVLMEQFIELTKIHQGRVTYTFERDIIFGGVEFEHAGGGIVESSQRRLRDSCISSYIDTIYYQQLIKARGMEPLFNASRHTGGAAEYISGVVYRGNGRIFFIPPTRAEMWGPYLSCWVSVAEEMRATYMPEVPPEWVASLILPDEAGHLQELGTVQQRIDQFRGEEAALLDALECDRALKRLFFASGDSFADAVMTALRELGFTVLPGPHPRVDLLGILGDAVIAVEAKGLERSANEEALRQADLWVRETDSARVASEESLKSHRDLQNYVEVLKELGVSTAQEAIDNPSKGIMVVNTFRKLPLSERTEPDFPAPLLPKIKAANVCALTGLDLLGLLMRVRATPTAAETIRQTILTTAGPLDARPDWRRFISKIDGDVRR